MLNNQTQEGKINTEEMLWSVQGSSLMHQRYRSLIPQAKNRNAELVMAFRGAGLDGVANRIESCSKPLYHTGQKLRGGYFCHETLCCICGIYDQKIRTENYISKIPGYYSPISITLTLPPRFRRSLSHSVRLLDKSWSRFMRTVVFKKHLVGGVLCMEFKSKKNPFEFHPHIHILADCRDGGRKELGQKWKSISGGYLMGWECLKNKHWTEWERKLSYIAKAISITPHPSMIRQAYFVLRRRKLFRSFQSYRNGHENHFPDSPAWFEKRVLEHEEVFVSHE